MDDSREMDWKAIFETRSTTFSMAEKLAFTLMIFILIGSLYVLVTPWYDRTNDGSTYIVTATAITLGEGYSYLGEPFTMRPPGFSWLTAFVIPDEGGTNFASLNWMVGLFGAFCLVLFYLHQRAHLGWFLSYVLSALIWLNPGYRRLCGQVMSDVPGLAFILLSLLILRWAVKKPVWYRFITLGVTVGLSAYVRSIAILLLPAIALAICFAQRSDDERREWKRRLIGVALVVVSAWLVLLPWNLHQKERTTSAPAEQTLNHSIETALWHEDAGDPASPRLSLGQVLSRIPDNLGSAAQVVGSRMQLRIPGQDDSTPLQRGGRLALALLLAAGWAAVLIRRRAAAEWFVGGAAAVIGIYFVFTDRLALPLFIFGLAATAEFARDMLQKVGGVRVATLVVGGALMALLIVDLPPLRNLEEIRARDVAFIEMMREVYPQLLEDARLAAGQGFHYSAYLSKPVYSLMHVARRGGSPAVESLIDRHGINTVLLSPLVPPDRALMDYFLKQYGPGTEAGPARIWRVR